PLRPVGARARKPRDLHVSLAAHHRARTTSGYHLPMVPVSEPLKHLSEAAQPMSVRPRAALLVSSRVDLLEPDAIHETAGLYSPIRHFQLRWSFATGSWPEYRSVASSASRLTRRPYPHPPPART